MTYRVQWGCEKYRHLSQNYCDSFLPLQDGQTPLLIATRKCSRMIVAALLEADANPNFVLQVHVVYVFVDLM